ncbi:hypothetical protein C8R47DRAFT_433575 [Mycena vitilis]|nr:hypothetical protein C8R47DRAFT_433575 [Mycena vitilis]
MTLSALIHTKLLDIFFVRALNARLGQTTPIIVHAVNPGLCRSELMRGISGILAAFEAFCSWILAFTTEVGSRQLVWAAVAQEDRPDSLRGAYIHACKVAEPSDFVLSAEGVKAQDRLWDELFDILGKVDSRVMTTVEEFLSTAPA